MTWADLHFEKIVVASVQSTQTIKIFHKDNRELDWDGCCRNRGYFYKIKGEDLETLLGLVPIVLACGDVGWGREESVKIPVFDVSKWVDDSDVY